MQIIFKKYYLFTEEKQYLLPKSGSGQVYSTRFRL